MSSLKIKEKIFPLIKNFDMDKLQYDDEGLYSISHPDDADYISYLILNCVNNNKNLKILDTTAGVGGNTISFSKIFSQVVSIEIDKTRFKMLENNVKLYNLNNVNLINDDCKNYLNSEYDIIFFDPPWGGPEYKTHKSLELFLGDQNLINILVKIPKNKYIILKLPFNYNLNNLKEYNFVLKKIRNILIVLISP